jgi:hypothetical protein
MENVVYLGFAHINAMLTILRAMEKLSRTPLAEQTDEQLTDLGKMLLSHNIKSLRATFPRSWLSMVNEDLNHFEFKFHTVALEKLTCEDFRNLWHCYGWHSCHHPHFRYSYAHQLTRLCIKLLENGKESDAWHFDPAQDWLRTRA